MRSWVSVIFVAIASLVALWATSFKLRLSPDVADLFPSRGDAAVMTKFTRLFSDGDLALVLLRGESAADVAAATDDLQTELATKPSVVRVVSRIPVDSNIEPTLAWALAGPIGRAKLAEALTPEKMRSRLLETRALLLAPGSSALEDTIANDPLRLALLPVDVRREIAAGASSKTGEFATEDRRARLLLVEPKGSAFSSAAVRAFVGDANGAIQTVLARHKGVTIGLTGGHAIAGATEKMMTTDLIISGALSTVLASGMFVLLFRRKRAIIAVLPPLLLGTLWTTGLASLWPHGISTIAVGFMSVVIGVGVDTGVHVYAALLDARKAGLSGAEAVKAARAKTLAPTFIAACLASAAFGSLALSEIEALAQLGVLCGAGEFLTAVAIQLLTPPIGAWLERKDVAPSQSPSWVRWIDSLTSRPGRARFWLYGVAAIGAAIAIVGGPKTARAIVAVHPEQLEPVGVQNAIYELFGGRPGQWLILTTDPDPMRARVRADAITEALEPLTADHTIDGFDSLTTFAPAAETQESRLAIRDKLDLPAAADRLRAALIETGFEPSAFENAVEKLRHPASGPVRFDGQEGLWATLASRHVRSDGQNTMVVTYVRPMGEPSHDERARAAILKADPSATITGFAELERGLKSSLAHDLPRIGLFAIALVAIVLRTALRSARQTLLALFTLIVELACLALAMRLFGIQWHVYDALVLPVLIGITIDETMFLLFASTRTSLDEAIREQAPLVACTALTTASGFAALIVCRFGGLRDLGSVGALGSTLGLFASLIVLPAALRLTTRKSADERTTEFRPTRSN